MKPYKGYTAKIEYDPQDMVLVGRVESIRDVVTFYATDVDALEREFHTSVDEYIAFCKERGDEPEKPFSGRILLRCPGELHKEIATAARAEKVSLNAWLVEAAKRRLNDAEERSVAAQIGATLLAGIHTAQSEHAPVRVQLTARPRTITPAIGNVRVASAEPRGLN